MNHAENALSVGLVVVVMIMIMVMMMIVVMMIVVVSMLAKVVAVGVAVGMPVVMAMIMSCRGSDCSVIKPEFRNRISNNTPQRTDSCQGVAEVVFNVGRQS